MITLSQRTLDEIVRTLVAGIDPEKIILPGSQVSGNTHRDSDLDLLIVEHGSFGKSRSRWKELIRIRKLLSQFRIPKDILLYNADEFSRWKDSAGHVASWALMDGRLLYDRR